MVRLNAKTPRDRKAARCIGRAVETLEMRRLFSVFTVLNTSDSGAGSFRQAILDANANAGADVIDFNIPGGGVQTISPASALPTITDAVTIDGYSQSGSSPNTFSSGDNAVLKIVLDGSNNNLFDVNGLVLAGGNSTVKGMVFNGWIRNTYNQASSALLIDSNSNIVSGDFFGTDATGEVGINQTNSVYITSGTNNLIGGDLPADRNIISCAESPSAPREAGITSTGGQGTQIKGNYIGTDAAGTVALNAGVGILLAGNPTNLLIGGTESGAGNLISGNTYAILLNTSTVAGTIQGNLIGTDVTGMLALPNGAGAGSAAIVNNSVGALLIGGAAAGARNIISGNNSDGVSAGVATVQGNYIGLNIAGAALPNTGNGVVVAGGIVGGSAAGDGNIISGNDGAGIVARTQPSQIQGNLVGLDPTGSFAIGNQQMGINVIIGPVNGSTPTVNATIGGTTAAARNIISGNLGDGVDLALLTNGNIVEGNYIGTDISGATAIGNGGDGIHNSALSTLIGGAAAGAGNVISGNAAAGILIDQTASVQGNYIGLNAAGNQAIANHSVGIKVVGTSSVIGGIAPNVISGNDNTNDASFYAGSGIAIVGGNSGVTVRGNFIGTNSTATMTLGNFLSGIFVVASTNNIIGGPNVSDGNIIAGNGTGGIPSAAFGGGDGITIEGNNNQVQNNFIGTNRAGAAALGNAASGIEIQASQDIVGGAGGQNTIAFNTRAGVAVGSGTRNSILANSIYSNIGLGIDLGGGNTPNGVTANHSGGALGANHFQNYPVLTSAISSTGSTTINGTLSSLPNVVYTLQFFIAQSDPSGFGQGKFEMGSATVTTDNNGNANFSAAVPTPAAGKTITATATDSNGNTSEFAANITAGGTGSFAELSGNVLTVFGSAGNDNIAVTTAAGSVGVDVNGQSASFPSGSVTSIQINAGDGADVVHADNTAPSTLMGGPGNDTLSVGGGNNLVIGGAGDDSLSGGSGNDTLWVALE